MRDEDLRKVQDAFRDMITPLVKPMLTGHEAHAFTTGELAAFCNMLEPAQQITVNRLRYLARAVRRQPDSVWHILQACDHENGWQQHLFNDLKWLKDHNPKGEWPTPDATLIDICTFASKDDTWKARVKNAEQAAIRFALRIAKHRLWPLKIR